MADKGLIIAACHHIIAVTLVLNIYSHTSQMNRAGKISFASSPLHPYWL